MNRREAIKKSALIGGSSVLGVSLISLLQSCQGENRLTWTPIFLNKDQAQLVTTLVDTILPKTDTPGGLDVKVDMFIDTVIGKLFDEGGQKGIVEGMKNFSEKCYSKFGKKFVELSGEEKKTILMEEEKNSPKFNPGVWGTAVGEQEPVGFYRSLKSLMLWGYFTSQKVGEEVLLYDPVPGEYIGCLPFKEVGKNWSL